MSVDYSTWFCGGSFQLYYSFADGAIHVGDWIRVIAGYQVLGNAPGPDVPVYGESPAFAFQLTNGFVAPDDCSDPPTRYNPALPVYAGPNWTSLPESTGADILTTTFDVAAPWDLTLEVGYFTLFDPLSTTCASPGRESWTNPIQNLSWQFQKLADAPSAPSLKIRNVTSGVRFDV